MKFPSFKSIGLAALCLVAIASAAFATTYSAGGPSQYPPPTYIPAIVGQPITITTAADVVFNTGGNGAVSIRISGTNSVLAGTVQVTNDLLPTPTNYSDAMLYSVGDTNAPAASFAANGFWTVKTAGMTQIRVHVTSLTGTAVIRVAGSLGPVAVQPAAENFDTAALSTFTAQAAATVNSADQVNGFGKCVNVVVDLTTMTTATVTTTIQGKDLASGKYYTLLAGAAKTSTGTTLLTVCPGSTAASNTVANFPLPKVWRVSTVVADNSGTAAVTGTIGASVIQ